MATCISHSPAETEALGATWGSEAKAGWVIGLTGELGAGKTQLVKGIARGLGVTARVHSPTFTLINEYSGTRLPLFHLDLYRLETCAQIIGAGLEEYLIQPAGVTVVEWVERWMQEIHPRKTSSPNFKQRTVPLHYRAVRIETLGANERRITYEDFGA